MKEEKEQKFLDRIEEVQQLIEKANDKIISLTDGIEHLAGNISKLKQIEDLNKSLNAISEKIEFLNECNKKLSNAFSDTEKYVDLNNSILDSNEKYEKIKNKLIEINKTLSKITSVQENLNIEELYKKIEIISDEFTKINDYLQIKIMSFIETTLSENIGIVHNELKNIKTSFNNELNNNIKVLTGEINELKNSFDYYKKENEELIIVLKKENNTMKEFIEKTLDYNKSLIELVNDIKGSNKSIDKYVADVFTKWYKENVTIFGVKKKESKKD